MSVLNKIWSHSRTFNISVCGYTIKKRLQMEPGSTDSYVPVGLQSRHYNISRCLKLILFSQKNISYKHRCSWYLQDKFLFGISHSDIIVIINAYATKFNHDTKASNFWWKPRWQWWHSKAKCKTTVWLLFSKKM